MPEPSIVFIDTETLGVEKCAPIWEFSGVRRFPSGDETSLHLFITHHVGNWLAKLPENLADDYRDRYDPAIAVTESVAAELIYEFVDGKPTVIGCNPGFDIERLEMLLARNALAPDWHYHPFDSNSIMLGYLAGRGMAWPDVWKTDEIAAAGGVDPAQFDRHTARGDVEFVMAQWDLIRAHQATLGAALSVVHSSARRAVELIAAAVGGDSLDTDAVMRSIFPEADAPLPGPGWAALQATENSGHPPYFDPGLEALG